MGNRPKMSREERAKQFMPFAALKEYGAALREKEKIIVSRLELSEESREELDRKFSGLREGDMATVIYYFRGEYLKITGLVSRIDETARILKIVNTKIPFSDIYDVEKEEKKV